MASSVRRRGPKGRNPVQSATANGDEASPDTNSTAHPADNPSAAHEHGWSADPSDKARTHPASRNSAKGKKRRHTFVFLLGSLFGLVAAGFFAKSNDLIDFPEIGELTMDSFFDVLPAGLVTDLRDLVVSRRQQDCTATVLYSPSSPSHPPYPAVTVWPRNSIISMTAS